MSIISFQMKTHSRENITDTLPELNDCIVHKCKPSIFKMVVGKRKEIFYVANCKDDDCGKIGSSADEVVKSWNKFNP